MTFMLPMLRLSLCLTLLPALAPLSSAAPPQDSPLERAESALEHAPNDPELLEAAARAAQEAGDADTALWYAKLARDQAAEDKQYKKMLKGLDELIASLAEPEAGADELLDAYAKEVFGLAKSFERRKLYANAVDLLVRCNGTRFEKEARKKLEKLYGNDKAVDALLTSGIEIPEKPATKKDPEWLAKEDAKHSSWDKAYEVEGKTYTIITNIGYEMAHVIHDAMEQMNMKLRQVFNYKTRGGGMRRTVIKVYKKRKEFETLEEGVKPGVLGFFNFMQFYIATSDPRDSNRSLTALWDTLFHEAAHQFKHSLSTNLIPAWANEGMACYFEGARLLPSGSVETNLIPDSRLRALSIYHERGTPTLKETISYFQPGSYAGEYYPMGWGLVYYLLNYENDECERVYRPIFNEWWETYKSGKQHDVVERWTEYFIEEAGVPGITNLQEFDAAWKAWIADLAKIHNGGPEQADVLIARARKQHGFEQNEAALESYTWALRKRPDDPVILHELASLQLEMDLTDAAIYNLRRLLQMSRGQLDTETEVAGLDKSWDKLAEEVVGVMTGVDRTIGEGSAKAGETFATAVMAAADTYVDGGFPRNALYLLENANAVLGGDGRLLRRIEELGSAEDVSLARWRRVPVPKDLEGWEAASDFRGDGQGRLLADAEHMATATTIEAAPERYRYEMWVEPEDVRESSVYGLVFGSNFQTGIRIFAFLPGHDVAGLYMIKEGPEPLEGKPLKRPKLEDQKVLRFAIEVDGTEVTFFLNDQDLGTHHFRPDYVRGGVGVFVQDTRANVSELRLKY